MSGTRGAELLHASPRALWSSSAKAPHESFAASLDFFKISLPPFLMSPVLGLAKKYPCLSGFVLIIFILILSTVLPVAGPSSSYIVLGIRCRVGGCLLRLKQQKSVETVSLPRELLGEAEENRQRFASDERALVTMLLRCLRATLKKACAYSLLFYTKVLFLSFSLPELLPLLSVQCATGAVAPYQYVPLHVPPRTRTSVCLCLSLSVSLSVCL